MPSSAPRTDYFGALERRPSPEPVTSTCPGARTRLERLLVVVHRTEAEVAPCASLPAVRAGDNSQVTLVDLPGLTTSPR